MSRILLQGAVVCLLLTVYQLTRTPLVLGSPSPRQYVLHASVPPNKHETDLSMGNSWNENGWKGVKYQMDHIAFPSTKAFLEWVNTTLTLETTKASLADWIYETDITPKHENENTRATLSLNKVIQRIVKISRQFHASSPEEERLLYLIALLGAGIPSDINMQEMLAQIQASMLAIYSTATVPPFTPGGQPLTLEPDLTQLLATSQDYDEQLKAYDGWRLATGPRIKPLFEDYVNLTNLAARESGYADAGVLWRAGYDMPDEAVMEMMERVWQQVLPLYEQLHCYTKHKLAKRYGKDRVILEGGYMASHIQGNMWSQDWTNAYKFLVPFKDVSAVDVTSALKSQGYTPIKMHQLSESFYVSLGYPRLPSSFWEKSMLVKPKNRDVVCHASAHDMNADDLRIKMCTTVTQEDLFTIHHEQGHLYYFHFYKNQHALFRDGSADFFHEAIGDTIVLSVVNPSHLKKIGLINDTSPLASARSLDSEYKQLINFQLSVALEKVALLPWTFLVDKWRWQVFSGAHGPETYQSSWLELVKKYQGLARVNPNLDDPNFFDPGSKFHIPASVPYLRYFGAAIIQFQFQAALCRAAGHHGPLHSCSIYQDRQAGEEFERMLKLGRSHRWQDVLSQLTHGEASSLDGGALLEYFSPLIEWLREQNVGRTCSWG